MGVILITKQRRGGALVLALVWAHGQTANGTSSGSPVTEAGGVLETVGRRSSLGHTLA